jgi:hypothetical protein
LDQNDNGTESAEQVQAGTFSIAANGRMTLSGGGGKSPIFYLVDSTQGFVVGTDSNTFSGYLQQQTPSTFSTATISGPFFFGGGAANTGTPYDTGTVNFVPGTSSGTFTGTDDESSSPNSSGLDPNGPIGNQAYSFSPTTATAPGQGNLGSDTLCYIISPTKMIFLSEAGSGSNPAEIWFVQQ